MAVYYYSGSSDIRTTEAVPFNGGFLIPSLYTNNVAEFNAGSFSVTSLPMTINNNLSFRSCAVDSNGNAWISGIVSGVYELTPASDYTSYPFPPDAVVLGTTTIGSNPYFVANSGEIYSIESGVVSGIGSFTVSGTMFLESLGNTLYSIAPQNSSLESYTLSGATTSYPVSGFTIPALLSVCVSGNYIAVGGLDNSTFPNGYTQMVSDILSNGDNYIVGVNESLNTIDYYGPTNVSSNTFFLKSSISGAGSPAYVNNTPNGEVVFVSNPTQGIVEVYENVSDELQLLTTFSVPGCTNTVTISNNAQALVLGDNSITPLILIGIDWSAQTAVPFTNPINGFCLSSTVAIVGSTDSFSTLYYNGSNWSAISTVSLDYTPTSYALDLSNNLYISGTASGVSYISMFTGSSMIGQVSWPGNVTQIDIIQDQLYAFDSSTNTIYAFELLNAIGSYNTTINGVLFSQKTPTTGLTYSIIPQTFLTEIPANSNGFVLTYFGAFVYSNSEIYQFDLTNPYTLQPSTLSKISIFNGTSWTVTQYSPNVDDKINAMTFDTNNNLWAVSKSNTLTNIESSTGAIISSQSVPPYSSAQANIPLGLSTLIYSNSHLYGFSCLGNFLVQIF